MPKDLTFNEDVRKKILSGMEKVNNAVGSTLGPNGNLVAIEKTDMAPVLTKDGVTVSKSIFLEDPVEKQSVIADFDNELAKCKAFLAECLDEAYKLM